MSKAEELAKKVYPIGDTKLSDAAPSMCRKALIEGYHQAVKEMIEWIEDNIGEYCYGNYLSFSAINIENIDLFDQKSFINDLRKVMK